MEMYVLYIEDRTQGPTTFELMVVDRGPVNVSKGFTRGVEGQKYECSLTRFFLTLTHSLRVPTVRYVDFYKNFVDALCTFLHLNILKN